MAWERRPRRGSRRWRRVLLWTALLGSIGIFAEIIAKVA